jgi:glycosyltransferase involved in cell wall biosynthesis
VLVIDSGSTDRTKEIAETFPKVRFIYNKFVNFSQQRYFAEQKCKHDLIVFLDSDEIANDEFVSSVQAIAQNTQHYDAYRVQRDWFVLGKKVHSIYPVVTPDHPIRMYDRSAVSFASSANNVHEGLDAPNNIGTIDGCLNHYTFETREALDAKLRFYTRLAAEDLIARKKNLGYIKSWLSSIAAFIKWYLFKQSYKDGWVGLVLAKYAYDYTKLKYKYAREKSQSS